MPQLSPMWWALLFIFFTFLFWVTGVKIHSS